MSAFAIRAFFAALSAAIDTFFAEYRRRKADADSGAAQQRAADDAANAKAVTDAKDTLDEWSKLTPEERARRFGSP